VVHPWRGLSGLPRASFAIALATFINRAGVMVRPFLVLYLTQKLGFSDALAGSMVALYGATTLVAAPLSGWLSDRLGARLVLRGSLALAALSLLVYPLASTPAAIALATVVFALFNELPRPALMTLVAEVAPPEMRRQAFVLSRLAINFGLSIGPAAGGFLVRHSYLALFLVDAGASLAAAVLLLCLRLPRAAPPERPLGSAISALLADRALQLFFAATLLNAFVFFQMESSMALFMKRDLGLPESVYGLMFTLNTLMIVLFEVELNTRLQHWPLRRSLVVGALLTTIGFGALVFAHGWGGVAAAVAIATVGEMVGMPAMGAFVVELAPAARRGLYMGTLTLAFGGGLTFGPKFGTWFLGWRGARELWLAVFAVGLVSTLLYALLPRRPQVTVLADAPPEAEAAETAARDAAAE
jgi:predicted MFS family arabinose efflux permease